MDLQQYIGDSDSHEIPLTWKGLPFVPGSEWGLIFTAKSSAGLSDTKSLFQKASGGGGITVSDNSATISTLRDDTIGLPPMAAVYDVQARHTTTLACRTVASGRLILIRDVTREATTTVPVRVIDTELPLAVGPAGKSAYDSYLETTDDDPALTEAEWSEPPADGEASVTNSAVIAAVSADKQAFWSSLGVPPYATLALANQALPIGKPFYNTTTEELQLATA